MTSGMNKAMTLTRNAMDLKLLSQLSAGSVNEHFFLNSTVTAVADRFDQWVA